MLDFILNNLLDFLYIIIIYFISLTVHEFAHGFVAYKLGDPTAKDSGRLSLNPIRHLDPVGLVMMVLCRFGWAKPVPVNPNYFKNPKKGMMLTAIAGPASNLILAFISAFFAQFTHICLYMAAQNNHRGFTEFFAVTATVFTLMSAINIGLAIFNLIPVYPLDGSRVLGYFMPNSFDRFMVKYGTYIYIAFFVVLLLTDVVSDAIWFVEEAILGLFAEVWYKPAEGLATLLFK